MENIDYITLVKSIEHLRLMKNTQKEWHVYLNETGFKSNNRGFKNRDAIAIFDKIRAWADKELNIDLYDLLIQYSKFSSNNFTRGTKRRSFINESTIKESYKAWIIPNNESSSTKLQKIEEEIDKYKYDHNLLFLIVTNIIPAYDANPTDISWDEHLADRFSYIKTVIGELYAEAGTALFNVEMEKHPYIKDALHKIEERIKSQEATRLDLIAFFINVTNNLYINSNKEALYEANQYIEKMQLHEIDSECLWIASNKELEESDFYWEFTQIGMDYFLYKYDKKAHLYTEYTIVFFKDKENIQFYAQHPESINDLCANKPIDDKLFVFGYITVDKRRNIPQEIIFHSYADQQHSIKKSIKGGFPPTSLKRITHRGHEKWMDIWKTQKENYQNKFPQYDYDKSAKEHMLTVEHIYIEKERSLTSIEEGTHQITSWYRIPRDCPEFPLHQISLEDIILTFHFLDKDYIFFVTSNICLDVTDDESRSRYGISIRYIEGL